MSPLPTSYYVIAFAVGGLLTVGLVVALIIAVRTTSLRLVCVGVGVLTFAVSQLFTRLPLVSLAGVTAGGWIAAHPWVWLVLLSLTAGLFEEVGRALGFGLLLRRAPDRLATPVAAGLGHGGLEAFVLVGVSQLASAATFLAVQAGTTGPPPAAVIAQRDALVALGPLGQLAGLYERFPAIVLHVALSVLVFTAVRHRRWLLLVLSILLHATSDLATAVCGRLLGNRGAGPVWLTEGVLTLVVAAVVVVVVIVVRTVRADRRSVHQAGSDPTRRTGPADAD